MAPFRNNETLLLSLPITGFNEDLQIRTGDDPCRTMMEFCGRNVKGRCLDQLVPPVQKVLERSWSDMQGNIELSDAYFCGCRRCNLRVASTDSEYSILLLGLLRRAVDSKDQKSPYLQEYNAKRVYLPREQKLHHYRHAIELVPSSGYIIDQLGLALKQYGRAKSAKLLFKNAVAKDIFPSEFQRPPKYVKGLPSQAWYEPSEFQFVDDLVLAFKDIHLEFERRTQNDRRNIVLQQEGLQESGKWEELVVMKHGKLFAGHAFPILVGTIKMINKAHAPTIEIFNVKFSILNPGTAIRPHCGPSNARLRMHITIEYEGGGAWIRVGKENRTWEREGSVLIFDDSFEHEVHHNGVHRRIVLIMDFWHPELVISERVYQ